MRPKITVQKDTLIIRVDLRGQIAHRSAHERAAVLVSTHGRQFAGTHKGKALMVGLAVCERSVASSEC